MMTLQLFDKKNNPISNRLKEINDERLTCYCDNIDFLPMGAIIDSDKFDVDYPLGDEEYFIVNKKDLNNVKTTTHNTKGCCGPDGDVLNIFDNEDNPIGYEYGDCWMSHFIKIPQNNVMIKEISTDNYYVIFAITEYDKSEKIVDRIVGIDYQDTIQKLKTLVNERLKWEIENELFRKELDGKVVYKEFDEISYMFTNAKKIEDLWLFTKYESV